MRRDMWNWVILYQFRDRLIVLFFACDNSVCLMFFFRLIHSSQRAHAKRHWLPLALLGGEK